MATMTGTAPDPNPYRLPFTREEYVAAQAQVWPMVEAEALAAYLFESHPNVIGITVGRLEPRSAGEGG